MFSGKRISFLLALFFLSLCTTVFLGGCVNEVRYQCSARPFEDTDNIKLMSFNIRYGTANDRENSWEHRKELVYDVICGSRADVVGLQEALRFQINQIRWALPEYSMIGVGRDDGKRKGEYCAILYRSSRYKVADKGTFWFSNMPWVPGSIHWGNACTRICTWARLVDKSTGKGFYVYNLHLDHVSQPSREKSVELLAKKIMLRESDDPYVVMGDFNAGEDNEAILYLKGKSEGQYKIPITMVDSYRVMNPVGGNVGTFNGFKGTKTGDKIDYIFVSPGTELSEAKIVRTQKDGRYPSDHFPVTTEVVFFGKANTKRYFD